MEEEKTLKTFDFKLIFRNLRRSWKFVSTHKKRLFLCLLFSLFLCVISITTPLLSAKLLLNLTAGIWDLLISIAIFIFVIEICRNICRYLYSKMFNLYILDTVSELQCHIAEEILNLETLELDRKSSGIFIDRLKNDTREIVEIFTEFGDAMIDVLANIGVLIAVFFVNKVIFVYFLTTSILLFILEKKRMQKYFEIDKKRRKISEKNTGLISELIRGIRDIKVLNSGTLFLNKTKSKLYEANGEQYKMQKIRFTYNFIIGGIKDFFDISFIFLGVFLVINNMLAISGFVIVYMYRSRVQDLLRYSTYVIELLKKFSVAADRVFEILEDDKFEKEKFGERRLSRIEGDFEFRDVHFSYTADLEVLKGVSFKVKANETVSFVGKSGSGKSTIFNLINKMYKVEDGNIFIDGIDINELTCSSIRDNISIITQNPYIFNFSIRENLELVKADMTEQEMHEVCQMACLDDFIETLPNKYETIVGEGGLALSGGQRQRLAIARALLKDTEIILFDEATSALDNETQEQIQKAINNMKGKYTILIIAHRLSTVINSDRILLVEDGKIIAEGSHNTLIKKNSIYKKLYEKELL